MNNATVPDQYEIDVVELGGRKGPGKVACRLGSNITFDSEVLETFSYRKWQSVVIDALIVAAAAEFCDRNFPRSTVRWGRKFHVRIPVHEPHRWCSPAVTDALVAALDTVTGDAWSFEFVARKEKHAPPAQSRLEFPLEPSAVMAFSDGMDSRAVDGLERKRLGNKLLRVRVGTKQNDVSAKDRLKSPFAALPYSVKLDRSGNADSSARSRGFKFAMVSGLAAYLSDAPIVIVPESGQGSLAPALLPVGQAYEDYRNHPAFTKEMERFLDRLLDYKVSYQFPRIWMTKGETLREYVDVCGPEASWAATRSCWQQSRHVSVSGSRRQCGLCAACILRRLSVHAAGLNEPDTVYVWESLRTSQWEDGAAAAFDKHTSALREYAIAGVRHFEDFATLSTSSEYRLISARRGNELAQCFGERPEVVRAKLTRLLQQHALEWRAFTGDLGSMSFISKWINGAS